MIGIVFAKEIDFETKLFIVLVLISLIILLTYLTLPMFLRRKVELLDYNPKLGGLFSWSAFASGAILIGIAVFKLQKSSLSKTAEEKQHENHVEREFRLRRQFLSDMHSYLFVMLLGVCLTLNFVFKVNRSREQYQAVIEGREPHASASERDQAAP